MLALSLLAAVPLVRLEAQAVVTPGPDPAEAMDSTDVLSSARREQAQFEIRRQRYLPTSWGSGGGPCDERVGRFCTWYDEGEWVPVPEASEVTEMRDSLLARLDADQKVLPGDGWLIGQRVWYRSEAGRWADALAVASACGGAERWWCAALEGYALHGMGRFEEAWSAFDRALGTMDRERAHRWRMPDAALADDAREALEDAAASGDEGALGRMWTLADPLFLVPGNDRETEHYARWTVATLRQRARNPFQISWGGDLEELTLRHGWEVGWERVRASDLGSSAGVVGHKHPEGRDYMPSAKALVDPAAAATEDLRADRTRPRSLYAPAYAPVLLPIEPQVAAFPRGDRVAVVATHDVPSDTTWHVGHRHERPWMEPGDQRTEKDRFGVFLVPAGGGPPVGQPGESGGASVLEAPAGAYVLSVESWSPSRRIAGRHRLGFRRDTVPEGEASLSDLLFVESGALALGSLEQGRRARIAGPADPAGEVLRRGVGDSPSGRRNRQRGVCALRRANRPRCLPQGSRAAGLRGPREPVLALVGGVRPRRGAGELRWIDLELPPLDPGTYRVLLVVTVSGTGALRSATHFNVVRSD